jgi:hypothetical protein
MYLAYRKNSINGAVDWPGAYTIWIYITYLTSKTHWNNPCSTFWHQLIIRFNNSFLIFYVYNLRLSSIYWMSTLWKALYIRDYILKKSKSNNYSSLLLYY